MTNDELRPEVISRIVPALFPAAPVLAVRPLRGGLDASVARLTIGGHGSRRRHIVVKHLGSRSRHEAARYHLLAPLNVTPPLVGVIEHEGSTYLFLEPVRPSVHWPWRDSAKTRLVLEQLARVHGFGRETVPAADWDHEEELRASVAETLVVAAGAAACFPELRRELAPLRRVAASLAEARRRMTAVLGVTLIHGDVHTRNVMLRRDGRGGERAVLLDWGRSRVGSPLEDVSSWLLSLRIWEPATARDHDMLLRAYLSAAGLPPRLTPELRDAYWFAAAGNALSGALRYHLVVARGSGGRKRAEALGQARAALRVIRRADERLRRWTRDCSTC